MLTQAGDHVNEDSSAGNDLGALANSSLYVSQYCTIAVTKANKILGCLTAAFHYIWVAYQEDEARLFTSVHSELRRDSGHELKWGSPDWI